MQSDLWTKKTGDIAGYRPVSLWRVESQLSVAGDILQSTIRAPVYQTMASELCKCKGHSTGMLFYMDPFLVVKVTWEGAFAFHPSDNLYQLKENFFGAKDTRNLQLCQKRKNSIDFLPLLKIQISVWQSLLETIKVVCQLFDRNRNLWLEFWCCCWSCK